MKKIYFLIILSIFFSGCGTQYIQIPCQKEEPERLSNEKSCTQQYYDGELTLEEWATCKSTREVAMESDFNNMREAFRSCK